MHTCYNYLCHFKAFYMYFIRNVIPQIIGNCILYAATDNGRNIGCMLGQEQAVKLKTIQLCLMTFTCRHVEELGQQSAGDCKINHRATEQAYIKVLVCPQK